MSQPVCRIGDVGVGVCYGHKTPTKFVTMFVTGDSTVSADGRAVVTVGGIGLASCGHTTVATSGSGLTAINGEGVHRIGDVGISSGGGVYVAVSGSEIVSSE